MICIVPRLSTSDLAIGSLKETAVTAKDLIFSVSGEMAEGRGAVDDGLVESANIDNDKGAGQVNGAERDAGAGTIGDSSENGEKIEARSRIYREA